MVFLCSGFTTGPSDVASPGLVEDGTMCDVGEICRNQSCVSITTLSRPQCPTDSNGTVCSGNGVK